MGSRLTSGPPAAAQRFFAGSFGVAGSFGSVSIIV